MREWITLDCHLLIFLFLFFLFIIILFCFCYTEFSLIATFLILRKEFSNFTKKSCFLFPFLLHFFFNNWHTHWYHLF